MKNALEGRTTRVTGGGLSRSIAAWLVRDGAQVTIFEHNAASGAPAASLQSAEVFTTPTQHNFVGFPEIRFKSLCRYVIYKLRSVIRRAPKSMEGLGSCLPKKATDRGTTYRPFWAIA
jgi:hypothetical protein